MTAIEVHAGRALVHAGHEVAFLDIREAGQFVEGHPLFAIPLPFSELEERIGALVPRQTVPILLIDDDDGVAQRAAIRLAQMRYSDIRHIEGGMPAWEKAGFPVYKGVNVPSKTLGEMAEHIWHPTMMTADELAHARDEGRAPAFFDARPKSEYAKMRVPGAQCLPNGELAHRLAAIGEAPEILVTCAGRTRGITGVIGLMLAGFEGTVAALENGTQGWVLSGRELERNNRPAPFPELDQAGLKASRDRADRFIERFSLSVAGAGDVPGLIVDPDRTTYVFDIRSPEEAAADPIAAAISAPSGQLVQATDQWVGVRNSRLVLCCDTGLRSALAAFWLKQLGYDTHIVRIDDELREIAARPAIKPPPHRPVRTISAADLLATPGIEVLDMRSSAHFRHAHLAGARWTTRPGLLAEMKKIDGKPVAILAANLEKARLFADDALQAGYTQTAIIDGGHAALLAAGARVIENDPHPAPSQAIDFPWFVHDRHDGNLEASRRYLAWETGLIAQLDTVERDAFRLIENDHDR